MSTAEHATTFHALRPFEARGRQFPGVTFEKPTMTQSQFAEESDINNIVAKYQDTGILPQGDPSNVPMFGDFSDRKLRSYQSAVNFVQDVLDRFNELPSQVRERVGNTPSGLINFLRNPDNLEEAIRLGLVNPPAKPEEPVPPDGSGSNPE